MQRNSQIIVIRIICLCILFTGTNTRDVSAQNADINILKNITQHRNEKHQEFYSALSFSVYPVFILTPATVFTYGLVKKDTLQLKTGLCIAAGLAMNTALVIGIKYASNRKRPYDQYPEIIPLEYENTPSFPSGHTSSAFNLATSLSLFYPRWYVIVPAYAWASGVAYSRMYLGVHYPGDVLAGALIGGGTAWLTYHLNKRLFGNSKNKKS